ncbi:hypothetical protein QP938_11270 [Porticoccaceae bacterium LTM1]|nr:hypothetical protein QP938_11270 [Porticoccaceae bacterium LTM1]
MDIKELPEVASWLKQFDMPDLYLAEYMLKKLRYVSLEEYEAWVQSSITNLLLDLEKRDHGKTSVAIFPVTKNTQNVFNQDKELKAVNDSSGRLGHALKNLERNMTKHIELSPRVDSMKARRVKHIIYVDDFTGTGKRFIDFWNKVSPSIKSWCSHGWCDIWFLTFAAHNEGLKKIVQKVGPLNQDSIKYDHLVTESFIKTNKSLSQLCHKYGSRLSDSGSIVGFGKQFSPIVFQYGCPNNAPGILWCKGDAEKKSFKPLFPNRSVPVSLFPLFHNKVTVGETAEDLWMARNYQLAVNFLENADLYNGHFEILTILSYLNAGRGPENVREVMVMPESKIEELFDELKLYGLIDEVFNVTRFGKDVLVRGSKLKSKRIKGKREYNNFYPATFLGFQREV